MRGAVRGRQVRRYVQVLRSALEPRHDRGPGLIVGGRPATSDQQAIVGRHIVRIDTLPSIAYDGVAVARGFPRQPATSPPHLPGTDVVVPVPLIRGDAELEIEYRRLRTPLSPAVDKAGPRREVV